MHIKNILKVATGYEHFAVFGFVIFLIFAFAISSQAAAGDLDPTFGGAGALRLNNPHQLSSVAIQADGKILSRGSVRTGSFDNPVYISSLVRFLANGGYDTGFGANGFLRPQVGQIFVNNYSFTLLPDDKIIVVGLIRQNSTSPYEIAFIRYNSNGQPDSTFGTNGVVTVLAPNSLIGTGPILIQPDGKILICGVIPATTTSSFDRNFILLRFNPNATPDTSFGNNGIVVPDPASDVQHSAYLLLLQADNKILVSGRRPTGSDGYPGGFTGVRFLANGALDASFGTNGKVITTLEDHVFWCDTALQPDGKIVMGGTFATTPYHVMLVRYLPDGQLDPSFGTNGIVTKSFNNRESQALGILIQPNGKILICGYHSIIPGTRSAALIARFNSSGTLDTSFGRGNGYALTEFYQYGSLYFDMALQPDGKLVAVGQTTLDKYSTNAVIGRYLLNDAPDFDFDGDGRADISVFRPSVGDWYISRSSDGAFVETHFGAAEDLIAPADFDGDGKTDICVFRPSTSNWYRLNSSDGSFTAVQFGAAGDLPVPGDFDGDGRADLTIYRPSIGSWYRINSINGQSIGVQFGVAEDKPLVADFDGDGKSDLTVFRPSNGTWYRINSATDTFSPNQFGANGDLPVAADYDGDGKTDLAVYRPSVGDWYIINSTNASFTATHFGAGEDKPAPADFDGDGKADLVVFRPSSGSWYLLRTAAGFTGVQFGANGDIPTPNAFVR